MIEPEEWSTQHETDVAIDFIRNRNQDQPFCLYVSWNPPHQPFDQVPDMYKLLYADKPITYRPNVQGKGLEQAEQHLRNYYAAVTATDDQFGRLLQVLEEEGLAEDTIVVLTSDHGEMMGSHGWLEHKNIWYEEAIGVPCFIRYPGRVASGTEDCLFNSSDLVPTLLGLMNLPIPDPIQGSDLSSVLLGQGGAKPTSAFICHYPGAIGEHEQARAMGLDINAYGWRGVRTNRYTYVARRHFDESKVLRLCYDNENDPYQLNPVMLDSVPKEGAAAELELELKAWLTKLQDPFSLES